MRQTKYKIPTYEEYADILVECLFLEDIEVLKESKPELYVTKDEARDIIRQLIKDVDDPNTVSSSYRNTLTRKCIRVEYIRSIKYKGRVLITIEAHLGNYFFGPRLTDVKRKVPQIHNRAEIFLDHYFDTELYQKNRNKRPSLNSSIKIKKAVTMEMLEKAKEATIEVGKGRYFFIDEISLSYMRPNENDKFITLYWPHDTQYIPRY